jgi:sugar/nucleoside kinase (ribokinase family)
VVVLELLGDGLDQGVLSEGVLHSVPDLLHQLEEAVRVHLLLTNKEHVGEDVIVALAKLVEEHSQLQGSCMSEVKGVYDGSQAGSGDRLDLVVVGAASRDLTPDDPRGWRLGGPAAYASLGAARLGLRVGCVMGVDGPAADASELELLEAAGVRLNLVPLRNGPVFENIEAGGYRRQRWLSKSDDVPLEALSSKWLGVGGWLLVPVAGELGPEWAGAAARHATGGTRVGLGWQGLLRTFDEDGWVKRLAPAPSDLVGRAGLVAASLNDLAADTPLDDVRRLAPEATLVLTAGEGGGLSFRGGRLVRYRAVTADQSVDPTGAGDVFLAALMAAWLVTGQPATNATLHFAAAAASFAVEKIGLLGVPTRAQVEARLNSPR